MNRKQSYLGILSGLLACGMAVGAAQAEEGVMGGLNKAVTEGSVKLDFRYRYENVDQDGFSKDANASTLRSRITFLSGTVAGLNALLEFDNVSYIGNDNFNSTQNGKVQYPVVADPKGTQVNQAWLKYTWEELSGAYGRQRILHGNQRFVGGVAWRQNEQTYDGFRAQWGNDNGLSLDYAYVYKVNRIFGPDDGIPQPAYWRGDNNLLRLDWKIGDSHSIAGYYYGLDIDNRGAWDPNKSVNNSTDTIGIEYSGKFGPFGARAAYATQKDAGDSLVDYDADYYMIEGAMDFAGMNGKIGYEVLGAGDGVGFKTPLATLHKFQGWADLFLVTPGDGIEDFYLGLTGALGPVKLGGFYHNFQAEDSSEDFGDEIDLVATWAINKQFTTQLKYANFKSDSDRYADTDKIWVTLQLKL
jgi:hypothetical protein